MDSFFKNDFNFSKYLSQVQKSEPIKYIGYVTSVNGLEIVSKGPCAKIGEICTIVLPDGTKLLSEVVGLDDAKVKLTAFGDTKGIEVGCEVIGSGSVLQVPVGMYPIFGLLLLLAIPLITSFNVPSPPATTITS